MIYNELIAYFMGGYITGSEPYEMPHGSHQSGVINYWNLPRNAPLNYRDTAKIGLFNYHNDWNCLHPVIDYIETLTNGNYRFVSYQNTCTVEVKTNNKWCTFIVCEDKIKLTATYKAVGKLITDLKNKYERRGKKDK